MMNKEISVRQIYSFNYRRKKLDFIIREFLSVQMSIEKCKELGIR